MNNITFVIPVHNRLEYTQECLKILKEEEKTSFFTKNKIHIIIVDDGSTDGTKEWVQENFPSVIVLRGDGNLWYSGAMNRGIEHAFNELGSNFIMVWENDIFPVDNYFENLQGILDQWDQKTLICSKLFYRIRPEVIFGAGGTFDPKTGKKVLIGRTEVDGPKYNKIMEVDWFLGQGVLIHKDIIDEVGYLDEKNFPQYLADIDYSLRAKYKGYKNIVYPNLKLLNDTATTGLSHIKNKTFRQFIDSLTTLRSDTNPFREFKFYRIHAKGLRAYGTFVRKYLVYIGSYIKWSVLGWFGKKRNNEEIR